MPGNLAGQIAPGALDGFRLAGIWQRKLELDAERRQQPLRIFVADLEPIAGRRPAADLLRSKGAAVVERHHIRDAVPLDHVADDKAHCFLVLAVGQPPGEDLA